jgi:hypothetical protein
MKRGAGRGGERGGHRGGHQDNGVDFGSRGGRGNGRGGGGRGGASKEGQTHSQRREELAKAAEARADDNYEEEDLNSADASDAEPEPEVITMEETKKRFVGICASMGVKPPMDAAIVEEMLEASHDEINGWLNDENAAVTAVMRISKEIADRNANLARPKTTRFAVAPAATIAAPQPVLIQANKAESETRAAQHGRMADRDSSQDAQSVFLRSLRGVTNKVTEDVPTGFVVPQWFGKKVAELLGTAGGVQAIPGRIPWADYPLLQGIAQQADGQCLIEWAAMKLDEPYSSFAAAKQSGSALLRQWSEKATSIYFGVSPGTLPFVVFRRISNNQVGFSVSSRVKVVSHPALPPPSTTSIASPPSTDLIRVQGPLALLEQFNGAVICPRPSKDGLWSANVPNDEASLKILDTTKVLALPLDNIVHGSGASKSLTIKFNWEKTKFADAWSLALRMQKMGACVTMRWGTLRCMVLNGFKRSDVEYVEKLPEVKSVFTDVHRDRLFAMDAAEKEQTATAHEADDVPQGVQAGSVSLAATGPKSGDFWRAIATQIGGEVKKLGTIWAVVATQRNPKSFVAQLREQSIFITRGADFM